jgi:hypothetical protein
MALDPSISLQAGKIPQSQGTLGGIERGMKLQQLSMQPALLEQQLATARQAEQASRAATAISEAQLPGVQAQAAGLVRGEQLAAAKVKSAQNAFDFDDDGNPVLDPNTNQPKFNVAKYQYGLHRSGQFDEALKAGADVLKQSKDAYDFTATARTQAALAAQAAYDNTVGTPQQKAKAAETMFNDMANRAVASASSIGFNISPEQFRYTPGLERALYKAAINPATQEQLKQGLAAQDIQRDQLALQTEQYDNSKKLNFTDDASLDPNSGVSQRARAILRNANIPVDDNMSAGELYRTPQYKAAMENIGANAGVARLAAEQVLTKYQGISKAVDNAKTQLSQFNYTPAQFIENWVSNNIKSTPELVVLFSELSRLDPKEIANARSFESLRMLTDARLAEAQANANIAVGGTAVRRPATAPAQPGAAPAQPGKFAIGSLHKDKATGIIYRYTGQGKTGFEEVK